jgi:hypothetical protein
MATSEDERHELYLGLEEVLGRKRASTLMAHLPPVGWADVATKTDLALLDARIEAREQRMLAEIRREITRAVQTMVISFVMAHIATAGLVLAAVRL